MIKNIDPGSGDAERANLAGLVLGGGGGRPDYLKKLVLGCIEADFCNRILVLKRD